MSKYDYKKKVKIEQDITAEEVGVAEVEAAAIEVVKKQLKREKIVMKLSEWSDFDVLANRINTRYGATLKSKTDKGATFEGKKFIVELQKI